MAKKKYCNRCAHDMWYDETKKRWYCTNPKCVKYKPQPEPTPEPTEGNTTQTTPSTGEPVQSESKAETEPTP